MWKSMVTWLWTYYWHKYLHPYKIKIYLSDQPLIKYDVSEVTVNFPPKVTSIGIVDQ